MNRIDAPALLAAQAPAPVPSLKPAEHDNSLFAKTLRPDEIVSTRRGNRDPGAILQAAGRGTAAHRLLPHRYEMNAKGIRCRRLRYESERQSVHRNRARAIRGAFRSRPRLQRDNNWAHINIGTGEHKAIEVPKPVIDAAGIGTRALEGFDRIALPVAAAIDDVRLASAVYADRGVVGTDTIRGGRSVA